MIILPTYLIMTRVLNLYDSYLALILLVHQGRGTLDDGVYDVCRNHSKRLARVG